MPRLELDWSAFHDQLLIGQKLAFTGPGLRMAHKCVGHNAFQLGVSVICEDRDVLNQIVLVQSREPEAQQVVIKLLNQQTLAAEREEQMQQQHPNRLFRGEEGRPVCG